MFQIGQSLSCTLLVKWASCTQRNPVTGLWHSDCVWMIPKGCCCNCIQIYHPLPCSECHQKTPDLEQLSDIFPESQARVWRPGNPPRSRHTEHPLSPLLLGNRNRHFFTPNWANLIFISHLGHGPSKQICFLFFFFAPNRFLDLVVSLLICNNIWPESWLAKNGNKKVTQGPALGFRVTAQLPVLPDLLWMPRLILLQPGQDY